MGLVETKITQNEPLNAEFIKPADLLQPEKFVIKRIELKSQFDKFKNLDIERIFLTLENPDYPSCEKVLVIQNETNAERLKWNFGGNQQDWILKTITLYTTKIEVNGKMFDSIRIRYNLINT